MPDSMSSILSLLCPDAVRLLLPREHSWTILSNNFFLLNFPLFPWQDIMEKTKDSFIIQNEEASVKYYEAELKQLSKKDLHDPDNQDGQTPWNVKSSGP